MKATIDTEKVTYETEIGLLYRPYSVQAYDDDITVTFGYIDGSEIPDSVTDELFDVVYTEIEAHEANARQEIEFDHGFNLWWVQLTLDEIALEEKAKTLRAAYMEKCNQEAS